MLCRPDLKSKRCWLSGVSLLISQSDPAFEVVCRLTLASVNKRIAHLHTLVYVIAYVRRTHHFMFNRVKHCVPKASRANFSILVRASSSLIASPAPSGAVKVLAALCSGPRKDVRRFAARALGALGWDGHTEVIQIPHRKKRPLHTFVNFPHVDGHAYSSVAIEELYTASQGSLHDSIVEKHFHRIENPPIH